jgi:hypothetical protein
VGYAKGKALLSNPPYESHVMFVFDTLFLNKLNEYLLLTAMIALGF